MTTDTGTKGISHTVHVGYGGPEDDSEFENIDKFENVVDIMNLPNGAVQFTHEGGEVMKSGARIIRSKVSGLDEAVRYRCIACENPESDMVSATDRGGEMRVWCPVCEEMEDMVKMGIDEL